jgi:diacylglycerol kinase (CTP)
VTAALFWSTIAPRALNQDVIWSWDEGVVGCGRSVAGDVIGDAIKAGMVKIGMEAVHTGGWIGLGVIGIVAGLVSGIAEALGKRCSILAVQS